MHLCGQPWISTTSAPTLSESSNTSMTRPLACSLQRQHRRQVPKNNWSPTGMSTLTYPLQHISGKDLNRCLRRPQRYCQNWRQNNHQSPFCSWHRWLSRKGRKTGKISWASQQSLHILQHGDRCRENQIDGKQYQCHQQGDQSKQTETWDSHKLGSVVSDKDSKPEILSGIDNSSIDKADTSLEQQEYFSRFQNTTDVLPHHTHPPVCVTSIFLYACVPWTLTAELQRRMQAMEIRCWRKILHIS